jgi:hypothetical protein
VGPHGHGTYLITEAQPSLEEEQRRRIHRYLAIMAIRIPALVLSAWLYEVTGNWVIALAVLIGSIPIPWIAVIRANDRPRRRRSEPSRYQRRPTAKPALESHPTRTIDG